MGVFSDVLHLETRAFHVLLIEDTVPLLQGYFQGKINCGGFQTEPSRQWYRAVREQVKTMQTQKPRKASLTSETENSLQLSEPRTRGITVQLPQLSPPAHFPGTLLFDSKRHWKLRSRAQKLSSLHLAWHILESYVLKHKHIHPC
ncbi:hypothetical protein E8E15_002286 [Penicillium rubens]|nr:hypothetical protein E8E15_002286 [Penicillium rubens]